MNKKFYTLVIICLMAFATGNAQNYNNGLRLTPGGSGNAYVAISGLSLDTMDFTVEVWIKADTDVYSGTGAFNDPSIFGNKDWDNGTNTGIEIAIYTGGLYKVNFTPAGATRVDLVSSGPTLMGKWNHIAVSVQRMGYIRLYSNGILTDSISINSSHGLSINGAYPYNFCDDGTGAYAHPISANVDEFRVWKGARTTEEIRKYMCRTLPPGLANLNVYYPMQQNTGTVVTDASGSGHNGTLMNATVGGWVASGAPVGDSSNYAYASSLSGVNVTVGSPLSGVFSVNNIGTGMGGVQVYRTNYAPNITTGVTIPGTDSVYFGVYPISGSATYQVLYDYTGYAAANSNEAGLKLFNRTNFYSPWSVVSGATKNTTTNTFTSATLSDYKHFVLGNFTNVTSVIPVSVTQTISCYPNPAMHGVLYFSCPEKSNMIVAVMDMAGKTVKTTAITEWPFTMDVAELPAGNYVVNCFNQGKSESFKITVTNK